jgi:hypothetical protein
MGIDWLASLLFYIILCFSPYSFLHLLPASCWFLYSLLLNPEGGGSMFTQKVTDFLQTTGHYNPEDWTLHSCHCGNIKSNIYNAFISFLRVLRRCRIRISAETRAILVGFHGFPQSLQVNARIIPWSGCNCFLWNPFQFIIHQSPCHGCHMLWDTESIIVWTKNNYFFRFMPYNVGY